MVQMTIVRSARTGWALGYLPAVHAGNPQHLRRRPEGRTFSHDLARAQPASTARMDNGAEVRPVADGHPRDPRSLRLGPAGPRDGGTLTPEQMEQAPRPEPSLVFPRKSRHPLHLPARRRPPPPGGRWIARCRSRPADGRVRAWMGGADGGAEDRAHGRALRLLATKNASNDLSWEGGEPPSMRDASPFPASAAERTPISRPPLRRPGRGSGCTQTSQTSRG